MLTKNDKYKIYNKVFRVWADPCYTCTEWVIILQKLEAWPHPYTYYEG